MGHPKHELRRKVNTIEAALFTGAPAAEAEVRRTLDPLVAQAGGGWDERVRVLGKLAAGTTPRDEYLHRFGAAGVRHFRSAGGADIYLLAIETFPDHVNNVYLMCEGARTTFYDCGSMLPSTQEDLNRALTMVEHAYGRHVDLDRIDDLVLSHGHIDHVGGVGRFKKRGTRIHVHEFDVRVVTHFEERIVVTAMQVRVFLDRAGVDAATRTELEQMYVFTKQAFKSVPVDRVLVDGDEVNGYRLHHAPGHCPGQVCMQVHDILLTADHVLPRITPHQAPESITPWTGLDHYLRSLERFRHIEGVRLVLPGHEEPIENLCVRIDEIEAFHRRRLEEVLAQCREPRTIAELAHSMFGEQRGYGRLLALEEVAAHVEYLSRRCRLLIANLDELTSAPNPPLRYRAANA
jgi:glyoxylase-like metal-dependent hydrolase (beta-lactamase superfamily II)